MELERLSRVLGAGRHGVRVPESLREAGEEPGLGRPERRLRLGLGLIRRRRRGAQRPSRARPQPSLASPSNLSPLQVRRSVEAGTP